MPAASGAGAGRLGWRRAPPAPLCLRRALGLGLASAVLVLAWAALETAASGDVVVLFAVAMLAVGGGPVLGLSAVVWLHMYRLQTVPGRVRTRATWAVAVTLAPAAAVLCWLVAAVVAALLTAPAR